VDEGFRVVGGRRLAGAVRVPGALDSALRLMAATLLTEGRTTLVDVPDTGDVQRMAELLRSLGCDVTWRDQGVLVVGVPADLTAGDRLVTGPARAALVPLLCRFGSVRVRLSATSTGLDDNHQVVRGLRALGARVTLGNGVLRASAAQGLRGGEVRLDFPHPGATELLLTAAATAQGTTVLENCAREPEVVDLCRMLRRMGAPIQGTATSTLVVEGVDRLTAVEHRVVPDRFVAGTWAFAAAITGGDVWVHNGEAGHLGLVLDKLAASGAVVSEAKDGFRVRGPERPRAVDVATLPYPGFPTELRPFVMVLDAVAEGTAMITENLIASRTGFVRQLSRLGAQVRLDGHHIFVRGVPRLRAATVDALDSRAGAALVIAGLAAEGETLVSGSELVDRGYGRYERDLRALGAEVSRVLVPDLVPGTR
jgi:UDP-N-acetylglucosamine 1-carboxyvinyltransferase